MICRHLTLALLAAGGLAASEIPVTDQDGYFTTNTVWLEAGVGSGVSDGDVSDVQLGGTVFDQSLDGSWRPGMHAGIEWSRTRMQVDGEGWAMGLALWYDSVPGRITAASTPSGVKDVNADLTLKILSLAIAPAWAYRFDTDSLLRVAPRDWQLEAGPVLALGMARTQVGTGDTSSPGFSWQAGARVRLHTEIIGGLRVGAYVGAMWLEARSEWDNTGVATFSGISPTGGLMLGYEF